MDLQVAAEQQIGYGKLMIQVAADEELSLNNGLKLALFRACNHCLDKSNESRHVVIVLPGGGYEFVSYREDRKVALAFAEAGLDAVVLRYHTKYLEEVLHFNQGVGHAALCDVAATIDELRTNLKLGLANRKIVLCGFSAGGHLAATMCTRFDDNDLLYGGAWRGSVRPDGAILCYPVISAREGLAHETTFTCFTGSKEREDWLKVSCEDFVTDKTPPAFIWHTATDPDVPVGNSLAYAQAMWAKGNKAELMIFPQGGHGLSLATPEVELKNDFEGANEHIARWFGSAVDFVKKYV